MMDKLEESKEGLYGIEPIPEEEYSESINPNDLTYKSVLFKSSGTISNQLEQNMLLNLSQIKGHNIGITYDDFQRLQSFDSRLISPEMKITSSDCQKSKLKLVNF